VIAALVLLGVVCVALVVVLARREAAHEETVAVLRAEARSEREALLGRLERERKALADERRRFDQERSVALDRVIAPEARRVELMREATGGGGGSGVFVPRGGDAAAAGGGVGGSVGGGSASGGDDKDDGGFLLGIDPDLQVLGGD
jgi:uncharacterized membrane protein YgcG